LEQLAQRGSACPLPGCIQGQGGWGFELPRGRSLPVAGGLEPRDLKGPFLFKPLYDLGINQGEHHSQERLIGHEESGVDPQVYGLKDVINYKSMTKRSLTKKGS